MRWGYSNLSLVMWVGLGLYALILGGFFKFVSEGRNKKRAFNILAISLVAVHSVLLISLGLNDSAASLKKVGFEVWVCGKPIQVSDSTPTGRLFRDGGYFSEKMLNVNSDEANLRLGAQLKQAGIVYSNSAVTLPVSNSFELKVAGDSSLDWLRGSLKYPADTNQPSLVVENSKLACPTGDAGVWNIFLAKVDNEKKSYVWQKLSLTDLSAALVRASDGNDIPDCLVMDYDIAKVTAEYRCADILKNDEKRCPDSDKSGCLFKEVRM
jgi:hypothetical protein